MAIQGRAGCSGRRQARPPCAGRRRRAHALRRGRASAQAADSRTRPRVSRARETRSHARSGSAAGSAGTRPRRAGRASRARAATAPRWCRRAPTRTAGPPRPWRARPLLLLSAIRRPRPLPLRATARRRRTRVPQRPRRQRERPPGAQMRRSARWSTSGRCVLADESCRLLHVQPSVHAVALPRVAHASSGACLCKTRWELMVQVVGDAYRTASCCVPVRKATASEERHAAVPPLQTHQ